jgi:hypothetical protein
MSAARSPQLSPALTENAGIELRRKPVFDLSHPKLKKLAALEGYDDVSVFLVEACDDSVCPAICCNPENPDCHYSEQLEPDQDRGWCDECQANTMKSALILAGII